MASELEKIAALQEQKFIAFTQSELRGLHKLVDHAHRMTVEVGNEELWLQDLEVRLATAIELPVDGIKYKEGLVALLPEHLQSAARRLIVYNTGDEHVAVAVWCEEDVFERAKEKRLKISREQVQEIIADMDRKQDCELGISWTTIDSYLDEMPLEEIKEEA